MSMTITPRRATRSVLALAATSVAFGAALAGAGGAQASDNVPCRAAHNNKQYCKIVQGHVPVLAEPRADAKRVGWLDRGGWANWFFYQKQGGSMDNGKGVTNNWWAYTVADGTGQSGYVSEIFFVGGANNEADAGLKIGGGNSPRGAS